MYNNKQHMINNKQRIIDSAFELSLKKGFDNVSMKQIQEKSGLSSGSLYYHFKNKNEILEYIVNKYLINSFDDLKEEVKNLDCSFMEKIRFILEYKVVSFGKKESQFLDSLVRPEFNQKDFFILLASIYHHHPEIRVIFNELHDEVYDFFNELIQIAIDNKEIREDIDIETFTIFIQTTLKGYVDMWIFNSSVSLEKIIDSNVEMIQEAIKA